MIKFVAPRPGQRALVGLGIVDGNIERLQQGRPILVRGDELGIDVDITIFHGKDERSIMANLRRAGVKLPGEQ